MQTQNQRKCEHGQITFGDPTLCRDCMVIVLTQQLNNAIRVGVKLDAELNALTIMNNRLLAKINRPLYQIVAERAQFYIDKFVIDGYYLLTRLSNIQVKLKCWLSNLK